VHNEAYRLSEANCSDEVLSNCIIEYFYERDLAA